MSKALHNSVKWLVVDLYELNIGPSFSSQNVDIQNLGQEEFSCQILKSPRIEYRTYGWQESNFPQNTLFSRPNRPTTTEISRIFQK